MNVDVELTGFPELRSLIRQKCVNIEFDGKTFSVLIKKLYGLYNIFRDSLPNWEDRVNATVKILWSKTHRLSSDMKEWDRKRSVLSGLIEITGDEKVREIKTDRGTL